MPARVLRTTGTAPVPLWRDVLQVLAGQRRDYTTESPRRAVVLLAVPTTLEMMMESLFALVSVLCVARLAADAIAVVGLTESVMILIYGVAIGLSIPAAAMIARRIGQKDTQGAAHVLGQVLTIGLTLSLVIGLLLSLFAEKVLTVLGAQPSAVAAGSHYARLMFAGNATAFMIFLINAAFRGAGEVAISMRTLCLANALNIILAPALIFGWGPFPQLGLIGAALATNVGRGAGVVYQLWYLRTDRGRLHLQLHHLLPEWRILGTVIKASANGTAQQLIAQGAWLLQIKILATFGSAALAGYTIAMRVALFAALPIIGIANAGATLVGQNLGAHRPDRAEAAVRFTVRSSTVVMALTGAVTALLCQHLIPLLTTDPLVIAQGTTALRIVSVALPLYAAGTCLGAAFNGAGDVRTPTRLSFICSWLGQLPLAWVLAHLVGLNSMGVFLAVPISFAALTVWLGILFRRGSWKLVQI